MESTESLLTGVTGLGNETLRRKAQAAPQSSTVTVSVVISAKDEAKSIGSVISGARESLVNFSNEIIVVDDGSRDGTGDIAIHDGARVYRHEHNMGKGIAMRTGAKHATGDVIVFVDGDGVHGPQYIPEMISPILEKKADLVIGSRFMRGFNTTKSSLTRRACNAIAAFVISVVISFLIPLKSRFRCPVQWRKITDCTSGFRAVSRDSWQKFDIDSAGFEIETEMLYEVARHNLKILEIPISCNGNGSGNISHLSIMKDGWRTLKMLARKLES